MLGSDTGRVFISYRRQETAWPARQLYELLGDQFGADQVFKDIDDIDPGDDFVDKITRAVSSCDVLLALIGEQWLTLEDEEGRRRLEDPADFVRLEIATALSRPDVRVIPILVDGARMPRAHELPPELEPLVRRQAVQLSAISFDASRLMLAVSQTLADLRSERADPAATGSDVDPAPREQDTDGSDVSRASEGTSEHAPRPWYTRRRAVLPAAVSLVGVLVAVMVVLRIGDQQGATAGGPRSSPTGSSVGTPSGSPADVDGPDVLAHRGGWEQYPLESLPALTSAARNGYAVETDVRWTRDDVPVIVHDEAARKGLDCTHPVRVGDHLERAQQGVPVHPESVGQEAVPDLHLPRRHGGVGCDPRLVGLRRGEGGPDRAATAEVPRHDSRQRAERADGGHLVPPRVPACDPRGGSGPPTDAVPGSRLPVAELEKDHLWAVAVRSEIASKKYVHDIQRAGSIVVDWPLNEAGAWARGKSVGADKVLTDYPQGYSEWLAHR